MSKFLLLITILVATACGTSAEISGAVSSKNVQPSLENPKISEILKQFTKILKGDPTITNSSVSAANGDTCVLTDFTDPNVLTVCDTLNTHLVCYRDNKCACLDAPQLLTEFAGSIPLELLLQIAILSGFLEDMGLVFFSSYLEPSTNRCVLKETSTCLREQISLEDLLGPIPGIDQISRSVFNLKCAPAFTCNQIESNDWPKELGKCSSGSGTLIFSSIALTLGLIFVLVNFSIT